ncbi:hypothetical protein DPMN_025647 [Dreissena polymorpha]|uniref:Uncharacterized protein n=1 Tax=Dreissena polymorpha TaxID=45954 RepID=A0A9D4LRR4_DREPO|nr:hypothetical protein DPMN_025647 [Dreissena polymorpha]
MEKYILERFLEWNSPLHVNIIKAFNSVDREFLQRLLIHYGGPGKSTDIFREA